ncbi:putative receptor-like protein kinase [Arachis hypogaea]|uniref:Putative receptor-like protein kinase n=1 Tax=Arachis hypogaea TaxID=3818 RepID=A0A6B9VDU8_ARAHY|nr:putative receptor-like protein kinase [Arachis hypogaea]
MYTIKKVRCLDWFVAAAYFTAIVHLLVVTHPLTISSNIVSLPSMRLLIFDNIENGSLKEHLNDPLKTPLNWRTRLQTANEVVAALEYLFLFSDPLAYHVSISSSNIMLDENFAAKIFFSNTASNFGLLTPSANSVMMPNSGGPYLSTENKTEITGVIASLLSSQIPERVTAKTFAFRLGSVLTKKAVYTVHFAAKGKCQTSLGAPNILQGSFQQVQNQNQHLLGSLNMKSDMNPMVRPQAVISDGSFVGGHAYTLAPVMGEELKKMIDAIT